MAGEADDDIELESFTDTDVDMVNIDYDLEYLLRKRRQNIDITREHLDEKAFEADFSPTKPQPVKVRLRNLMSPPEPIKSALTPPMNKKQWLQFLFTHLPILSWVWSYQPKSLVGDVISGITVAIMHIPQGLAYALLANLPAVYGLYAAVMPPIVYAVFGTSRHISVGTFAVVELMIGNAIERVLTSNNRTECIGGMIPLGNGTVTEDVDIDSLLIYGSNTTTCGELKVEIAITLAFMTGVIMILMGLAQLGFITIFLSDPLVSGYTTGAAVHVFTSQLKHITGIETNTSPGLWRVPRTWINTFSEIENINWAAVIISIVTITSLIILRIVNKKLMPKLRVPVPSYSKTMKKWKFKKTKWPIPIPSQLIAVILGTLVSYLFDLNNQYDVPIVGEIPKGAPPITPPNPNYFMSSLQDAFVISIVAYSVTVSLAQVFAKNYNYPIHANQEFLAYGAMNLFGSLFSSFTAAGSLSRSLIQANSGGKTQLVSFISSILILVVLLALGSLFEPLPRAVLASIIWVALYGMFQQVVDIWNYFKLSFMDLLVWLSVFLGTAMLGVDIGLGVGVTVSLGLVVFRTILPYSSELGRAKDTEIFRNTGNFDSVTRIPGVVIFRFQAPLIFVNSKVFRARLEMVTNLDKTGMNENGNPGCVEQAFRKTCCKRSARYDLSSPEPPPVPNSNNGQHDTSFSAAYETTGNITRTFSFQQAVEEDVVSNLSKLKSSQDRVHTVILDCAPIGFMDAMGVKTLQQIVLDFSKCGVQVVFAAMTKENRDVLERAGFIERCGKEWLFPSIQDAVHHSRYGTKLHPAVAEESDNDDDDDDTQQQQQQQQQQLPQQSPETDIFISPRVVRNVGNHAEEHVNVELLDTSHSE